MQERIGEYKKEGLYRTIHYESNSLLSYLPSYLLS